LLLKRIITKVLPKKIKALDHFKKEVDQRADRTTKEIAQCLGNISQSTVQRALKRINYTRKKKSYHYKERKEEARREFLEKLEKIPYENRVYFDEYGIDDNEAYPYAWGLKGHRLHFWKSGKRCQRLSGCAALHMNKLIAPFTLDGFFDRAAFEAYIEYVLIPVLRRGMVFIMDNASFHKSAKVIKMIEEAGCSVLFLPTYSPDLNPIEHMWAPLKNAIRKLLVQFPGDIFSAVNYLFQNNCCGIAV
jgi:transposase